MKKFYYVLFVLAFVFGCSDSDDPAPVVDKSSAKSITSFKFSGLSPEVTGTISETDKKITLTVPSGTAVTALAPTIVISDKATVSPASGTPQDFTSPVKYKVTAEDGTNQEYTVTVTVTVLTAKSSAKVISSFKFSALNPEVTGTIEEEPHFIKATVPNATNRTALVPTIGISEKATISPASGVAKDFTNPVVYTVTAEDGTFQEYLVTVSLDPTVSFTVNPVTFLNLQQDGGMFIGGTNLGTFANNKFVLKNRDTGVITDVPATGGNATFLSARVPATLALGTNYQVTVFIGLESKILPETFTVGYHDVEFTSIIPNPIVRGHNIIITGKYFMSSGNVVKLESTILSIVSESATSIEVTVPASLEPGDYTLNITSNGKTFFYNTQDVEVQVDPETPIITDLNDDMGSFSPGETIIITGEKLNGASPTIYFTVFQNGVNSSGTITVNGDGTSATYVIPNDFVSGTYAITVKVDGFESVIYGDYIHIAP